MRLSTEYSPVKLRYWFAAATALITVSFLVGANWLLQDAAPYESDDVEVVSGLLQRYARLLGAAVLAAVGTGIVGAVVALLTKRRELAVACLFSLISVLVSVGGATLAFSGWDWIYVPAACALGVLIGRAGNWNSLVGLSATILLASIGSTWAMKLFMWLA